MSKKPKKRLRKVAKRARKVVKRSRTAKKAIRKKVKVPRKKVRARAKPARKSPKKRAVVRGKKVTKRGKRVAKNATVRGKAPRSRKEIRQSYLRNTWPRLLKQLENAPVTKRYNVDDIRPPDRYGRIYGFDGRGRQVRLYQVRNIETGTDRFYWTYMLKLHRFADEERGKGRMYTREIYEEESSHPEDEISDEPEYEEPEPLIYKLRYEWAVPARPLSDRAKKYRAKRRKIKRTRT